MVPQRGDDIARLNDPQAAKGLAFLLAYRAQRNGRPGVSLEEFHRKAVDPKAPLDDAFQACDKALQAIADDLGPLLCSYSEDGCFSITAIMVEAVKACVHLVANAQEAGVPVDEDELVAKVIRKIFPQ